MSAVVWIGFAAATAPPLPAADLRSGEPARLAAAATAAVVLTIARRAQLVGLQAPKLPLGRVGFTA